MDRPIRLLPALLLLLLLPLCDTVPLHSQSLQIFNVDASGFPDLKAQFILRDAAGHLITGTDPGDFTFTENDLPVSSFQTDCPPLSMPAAFTAVLVCDRSGSMNSPVDASGLTRMELLKAGVRSFITAADLSLPTKIAITGFNKQVEMVRDFTSNEAALLSAAATLAPDGGTDYNPAFLDPEIGAIALLKEVQSSAPRHIIFITDGQPLYGVEIERIIREALMAQVKIHVITLALPLEPELKEIATRTGGLAFSNVLDSEELKGVYDAIAMHAQGMAPCTITWRSFTDCDTRNYRRTVALTYNPLNVTGRGSYIAPPEAKMFMLVDPELLYFGAVPPGQTASREITLTASGGDFSISDITLPPGSPFAIVDWGGTAPPFQILKGHTRRIRVSFTPPLESIYTARLRFTSSTCAIPPVTLNGGKPGGGLVTRLELVTPNGGESFSGCDSVVIRWTGVPGDEPVDIEYSDDNGRTWRRVANGATGLSYRWVPPGQGSSYRIRISQPGAVRIDTVRTVAGGGDGSSDAVEDMLLHGPSSFASSGDLLFVAEEGGHVVRMIDTKAGRYSTVAGTGSNGYSGDGGNARQAQLYNPSDVAVYDRYLFIADQSNHAVRRVDLATGVITTFAGTGQPGFSGDGGPANRALLSFPTHVTAARDMLYIAERGNNRIRRVDMMTGIITTVAGGGTDPGAGPSFGPDAELKSPAGMAVVTDPLGRYDTLYFAETDAHRIRRLDLRSLALTTAVGDGSGGSTGDGGRGIHARVMYPRDVTAAGDLIYIADTRNYMVREFNRINERVRTLAGSGRNNYTGDGGPATDASFSWVFGVEWVEPNRVYVADFTNNAIRSVLLGEIGRRDSSDAPFAVAIPILRTGVAGRSVEFGNLALDASRDSSVTGTICNQGSAPVAVDTVIFQGAHPEDFMVVSGVPSGEMAPGDCATIEFRFQPKALGRRTAQAIIYGGCSSPDTLFLSGTGLPSCGLAVEERADLGEVELGTSSGDLLISEAICNSGDVTLEGNITIRSGAGPFTIVSGGGAFRLLPGECHQITIRFTPAAEGRVTAQLDYGTAAFCDAPGTILLGRGTISRSIDVPPSVEIPAIACDPARADTTIVIRNNGTAPLVITGAELTVNNEGFTLLPPVPAPDAPLTILPGASGTIGVRFQPLTHGAKRGTLRITTDNPLNSAEVELGGRYDMIRIVPDVPLIAFDGMLPAGDFPRDSFVVLRNTGTTVVSITSGSILGTDDDKFEILPGQFPLAIEPGDSARINLRALEPTAGSGYRAILQLSYQPACDTGIIVELFESGTEPALSALPPAFRDIICDDDPTSDTLLHLSNPGGAELRIAGYHLRNNDAGAFIFDADVPITIPARGSISLPIRFAPPLPGTFNAELVLMSNGAAGETIVPLAGRRESISVIAIESGVQLGHILPGENGSGSITLRNTGTAPVEVDLPPRVGALTITTPSPLVVPPGGERQIDVELRNAAEGDYADTLRLTARPCGDILLLPVSASVFVPAYTIVDLPEDSAAPGSRVTLPIRISIADREIFASKGAGRYRAVITFNGLLLSSVEAEGARIESQSYDPRTATRRIVLTGEYPGTGDTLAALVATVPVSTLSGTPLRFEEFTWDHPHVLPEKLDGFFTKIDTCAVLSVVSRPKVLKIRPMPVTADAAVAEIALEDALAIRATIVDHRGAEVRVVAERRYAEGEHQLPLDLRGLPSGLYSLVLHTVFGSTVEQIMVVK